MFYQSSFKSVNLDACARSELLKNDIRARENRVFMYYMGIPTFIYPEIVIVVERGATILWTLFYPYIQAL